MKIHIRQKSGERSYAGIIIFVIIIALLWFLASSFIRLIESWEPLHQFMNLIEILDPLLAVMVIVIGFAAKFKLNDITDNLKKNEERLAKLMLEGNIFVEEILMKPCSFINKQMMKEYYYIYNERDTDLQNMSAYRIIICFHNKSQSLLDNMELKNITVSINGREFRFREGDKKNKFFLFEDRPCIELVLQMRKGGEAEKTLSQFYFYYWQLQRGYEKMILNFNIEYKGSSNNRLYTRRIKTEMRIEPQSVYRYELESVESMDYIGPVHKTVIIHQEVGEEKVKTGTYV